MLQQGQESASGIARCYRHPMRETGVHCTRCGRPICPDCMRPASVGFHCPDDVKLDARSMRAPRTVVGAPVRAIERSYVTWGLIAANVIVYVLTVVGSRGGINSPQPARLFRDWTMSPYLVAKGSDAHSHEFYRLITSAFLHLNLTHLVLNMIALAFVGPFVERAFGWWRFTAVYLLAAVGGSVAVYYSPDHFNAVAGASGAIYGLFAAALVLARRLDMDLRAFGAVVAINFLFTFTMAGISVEGHVGGFLIGGVAALGLVGWPQRKSSFDVRLQIGALVALLVALLLLVTFRTYTFPSFWPSWVTRLAHRWF
ncbi:MAG: rane protein [Pseudonocardiales bacterium]|nr:rane protein [Pseudonocardiales bacterium]